MEIILQARQRRVKEKVERDHQWYDTTTKRMLTGRGGEMRFRYENNRNVPYLVDHEDWVWKNDYEHIMKWVKNNTHKASLIDFAQGHYVLIDVESGDVDSVTADLNREGFLYDD